MMASTKSDQLHDVEAATVGGIEEKEVVSTTYPRTIDTTIVVTTMIYTVMIIILFVSPLLVPADERGTLDGLLQGLAIIVVVGGGALMVAAVNLVLTVRRWAEFSTASKAVGLLPTVCSIVIVVVVSILMELTADYSDSPEEPYECLDYTTDCKNQTEFSNTDG